MNNTTLRKDLKTNRDPYKNIHLDHSLIFHDFEQKNFHVNFPKNYFGLPIHSIQQNPNALVYRCRRPLKVQEFWDYSNESIVEGNIEQENEKNELISKKNNNYHENKGYENNFVAQRKVSLALLTMAKNDVMVQHFLHKGGVEAVFKLIQESKDAEVLTNCALSLVQISSHFEMGRTLVEKNIQTFLSMLTQDLHDEYIKHLIACVLGNLSSVVGIEDLLAMNSILTTIQYLIAHTHHRLDTVAYLLMSLSNVCMAFTGQDAEVAQRLCLQTTKRLDSVRNSTKALFVSDVLVNFSRVSVYGSLLVDEGVLPMLLHIIDTFISEDDILKKCTETYANLSSNRKNRREIASSGIASRLNPIFENGSTASKSNTLLLMGNLLSSNLFHDKVANERIVSTILDHLLDLHYPKQFVAVAYCVCQLSKISTSCEVMIDCQVVPILLGYVRQAPSQSLDYLWTTLVNISFVPEFFPSLLKEAPILIEEMFEEVRFDASTPHQMQAVAQIALNISRQSELAALLIPSPSPPLDPTAAAVAGGGSTGGGRGGMKKKSKKKSSAAMDTKESRPSSTTDTTTATSQPDKEIELIEKFVKTLKAIFISRHQTVELRNAVLEALTFFSYNCPPARSIVVGKDIIHTFIDAGIRDDRMNVRYVGLLNIVSNDESCCYRLLEQDTQSFIVSLQESFIRLTKTNRISSTSRMGNSSDKKRKPVGTTRTSMLSITERGANGVLNLTNGGNKLNATTGTSPRKSMDANHLNATNSNVISSPVHREGEEGLDLSAATLHNLALKRAKLAPGVLSTLLALTKNTKDLRVLYCTRTLAHMSVQPKAKIELAREARKVIPLMTVLMRCGCEEAEKVQHYSAIVICNILSMVLDKTVLLELLKTGAVVDLVVVTLLRINSHTTEEVLGKAFFNLLSAPVIRPNLILNLDILSSILELSKVDYINILELCVRIFFNVSCELRSTSDSAANHVADQYATKLIALKVPQFIISKLNYSPDIPGSLSTRQIRLLLGMTLANMSFNRLIVVELTKSYQDKKKGKSSSTQHHPPPVHSNVPAVHGGESYPKKGLPISLASASITSISSYSLESEENKFAHAAVQQLQNQQMAVIPKSQVTITQALNRVYNLDPKVEETKYCTAVTLFNISLSPHCKVLAQDTKAVDLLVDLITHDNLSAIICIKLAVATLCNFSTFEEFGSLLSSSDVMSSVVTIMSAPQLHVSVKIDAVQLIYNLVTRYSISRKHFIESNGVSALWKVLKIQGRGGGGGGAGGGGGGGVVPVTPKTIIAKLASSSRDKTESLPSSLDIIPTGGVVPEAETDGPAAPGDESSGGEEDRVVFVISHIVKELSSEIFSDVQLERKALSDGIMNIILKLSKIESTMVKLDMSFAIYEMTQGVELMKVLKWDAVDILFWLTLHDTLRHHDHILRNVARALRAFSIPKEESRVVLKQERFFSVFKSLIKSTHEDVLWQSAGVLYNLMQVDTNLKYLLDRGLVNYIFEIASSGYESVKHICSACLHMIPESMPNLEDPLVLELVLALLEAQGDKFSQVSQKPRDQLLYSEYVETYFQGSLFEHVWTNFSAVWSTLACTVDNTFTGALQFRPDLEISIDFSLHPTDVSIVSAMVGNGEVHQKILGEFYNQFSMFRTNAMGAGHNEGTGASTDGPLRIVTATPQLNARPPPNESNSAATERRSSREHDQVTMMTSSKVPSHPTIGQATNKKMDMDEDSYGEDEFFENEEEEDDVPGYTYGQKVLNSRSGREDESKYEAMDPAAVAVVSHEEVDPMERSSSGGGKNTERMGSGSSGKGVNLPSIMKGGVNDGGSGMANNTVELLRNTSSKSPRSRGSQLKNGLNTSSSSLAQLNRSITSYEKILKDEKESKLTPHPTANHGSSSRLKTPLGSIVSLNVQENNRN